MRWGTTFGGDRPRLVLHPMLLASGYVLNLGLSNEVELTYIVRPLLVAIAGALALTMVGWAAFRNRWDGALAATAATLLILSLVPLLLVWTFLVTTLGQSVATVVVAAGLIGGLGGVSMMMLSAIRRRRPVPRPPAGLLNVFAVVLVATICVPHVPARLVDALGGNASSDETPNTPTLIATEPPDIVLIMLDGYPREDVLERRFEIDNEPFRSALRDRGFDVGEASRSNYNFTSTTLASMFQMTYLDEMPTIQPLIGTDGAHRKALRDAAAESPGLRILRAAGYDIITAPSGWLHASIAAAADQVLDHGEITNVERKLLELTWLMDAVDVVWPAAMTHSQRNRIVRAFDDLETFAGAQRDSPAFFFAHIPAPHLPLVLDAEGEARSLPSRAFEAPPAAMTRAEYVAAWSAELTYVNRRVLQVVDALQSAPTPPVIVVMSDHGYGHEPHPDDVQALFANLFAAHTPAANSLLADTPTPVNLLPLLFNRYLGTDLSLSPDRYFIAPGDDHPLLLTEVNDPERIPAQNGRARGDSSSHAGS